MAIITNIAICKTRPLFSKTRGRALWEVNFCMKNLWQKAVSNEGPLVKQYYKADALPLY